MLYNRSYMHLYNLSYMIPDDTPQLICMYNHKTVYRQMRILNSWKTNHLRMNLLRMNLHLRMVHRFRMRLVTTEW